MKFSKSPDHIMMSNAYDDACLKYFLGKVRWDVFRQFIWAKRFLLFLVYLFCGSVLSNAIKFRLHER